MEGPIRCGGLISSASRVTTCRSSNMASKSVNEMPNLPTGADLSRILMRSCQSRSCYQQRSHVRSHATEGLLLYAPTALIVYSGLLNVPTNDRVLCLTHFVWYSKHFRKVGSSLSPHSYLSAHLFSAKLPTGPEPNKVGRTGAWLRFHIYTSRLSSHMWTSIIAVNLTDPPSTIAQHTLQVYIMQYHLNGTR
jgi:hypothetical protein